MASPRFPALEGLPHLAVKLLILLPAFEDAGVLAQGLRPGVSGGLFKGGVGIENRPLFVRDHDGLARLLHGGGQPGMGFLDPLAVGDI